MKTHLIDWMNHFELSVEELGAASGISPKVINKWLSDQSTPSLAAITQISETLGITIDDIVNNSPEEAIGVLTNNHLIETTNIKTAVRVQNYFNEVGVEHQIVVRNIDDVELFLINYTSPIPLDIKQIIKISRTRKYKDSREKESDKELRYENMSISNM